MADSNTAPIGAIVVDGIVQSLVYPHPDDIPLDECFPAGVVTPIPAGTVVTPGMTWNGTTFGPAPAAPALTPASLTVYAASALAAKFVAGETFNVAASGSTPVPILCDGTNDTRADLGLLALYGQDNPTGTRTWIDNNGVASVLTGAQFVTLATLAGTWVSDCYPVLATVLTGIASGKVTKASDVDAAFAAVTA